MKIIHKTRLLVINDDQLLVIEKIGNVKELTFPGGIKKRKESFEQSLVRETLEEIGLRVNLNKLSHIESNAIIKALNTVIKHHFVASLKTDAFKVVETEKFKDVYWMYWKDTLPYLDKEDKKVTKKYFKKRFKKKPKPQTDESSISPRIAM
ncbi:hypothetical protein IMCC3317_47370 [Kordia antarctica]|uniref:Nudix hydrolase domain-containing protein n=1 Tax=Kordia antarctica TaxID=1218801 RepID=A0A7L4ZS84_9FLAO|nr:NUDIX hydrolase [Kordia antarctica]QHI39327.1 hypothetical protein IMCC3317_47370 [Kordia antarctica]